MTEAEARCVHELLPGQCADCSGRDGGETAERAARKTMLLMRGVVAAHHPGRCANCGGSFGPGTPIRVRPGDEAWVAACCLTAGGRIVT